MQFVQRSLTAFNLIVSGVNWHLGKSSFENMLSLALDGGDT
jgi:hypothetical protein